MELIVCLFRKSNSFDVQASQSREIFVAKVEMLHDLLHRAQRRNQVNGKPDLNQNTIVPKIFNFTSELFNGKWDSEKHVVASEPALILNQRQTLSCFCGSQSLGQLASLKIVPKRKNQQFIEEIITYH